MRNGVWSEKWGYCIMSEKVFGVGYMSCLGSLGRGSMALRQGLRMLFAYEASLQVLSVTLCRRGGCPALMH